MSKKSYNHPDISETAITSDLHVKGDIASENDVWIDGHIEGGVSTHGIVTLGQNARVEGDITARLVRINGHVEGNVEAGESLTCHAAAVVQGDITTRDVRVDSGAVINGRLTTFTDEGQNTGEE